MSLYSDLVEVLTPYANKIKGVISTVGDLNGLETTDKSSIVAAINEAAQSGGTEIVIDNTLTQSGQAADAKAVGDGFGQLKADLGATNNDLRKMVGNIPSAWTLGGMYAATGIEYGSTSVIRTPFIQVEPGDTIYFDNPDTSLMVTVFEFATNTPTSAGVNERLAVTGVTNLSKKITLGGTTNYIRLQMATGDTLKGDDVLAYTKNNIVFDSITEASEGVKNAMNDVFAPEPIIPIVWEQGRLSVSGTLVASNYVIRSKDFIYVDDKRRSISVMYADYDLPAGSTGLKCNIFEYSSTDPVTFNSYYEYISRDGDFTHVVASDTVAIKITMYYLTTDTYYITPDKGYLITPMWEKDGLTHELLDRSHIPSVLNTEPIIPIIWEQGRLTTTGGTDSSDYVIRSKNFISLDGNRRSISVLFGDYDLPSGSTALRFVIFEYSATDPVSFISYTEYLNRDGNITHTFAQNATAFKVALYYLSGNTYAITPDKGYLITPMWEKDDVSSAVVAAYNWGFGQCKHIYWGQGRLTASGEETSAAPPRIRTGFIGVQGIKRLLINAPENTQFGYFWYDADRAFISSNSYIMSGVKASNRTIVDVPVSAYYLRLVVGKLDNSAISTAYGDDVTLFDFASCDHGKIENNPPMLSIMDDDGYIKFYTDLYPILADRKVPACSAVIVGQVGLNANRMTWAQIEEMYENGIEIISHTYSHWPDANEYPNNVLTNDYQKSVNILNRHGIDTHGLGVLPQSSGIIKRFRDAGKQVYKGIFVNGESTNYKGFDPYSIRRYKVGNNTTTHIDLDALKALIDTLTSGWMILSLHTSTGDGWVDGTGEGSSAYIIGQAIDYALSKGIPIVTCECGFRTYSTEWNCTQVPDYES